MQYIHCHMSPPSIIPSGFVARNNLHIILPKSPKVKLRYILGLLNSRMMDFVYTLMNPEKGEALAEVKKQHVELLPIPDPERVQEMQPVKHERLVAAVELMLDLTARSNAMLTDHDKDALRRQIDAVSRQIDEVVYELYGLSPEEIALVEYFPQPGPHARGAQAD